jgi:hypothetical protein
MRPIGTTIVLVLLAAAGCGGPVPDTGPGAGYRPCILENRTGEFLLKVDEQSISIDGTVLDGIEPARLATQVLKMGDCQILKPSIAPPPCKPECGPTQNCTKSGCVQKPVARNVGRVSLRGLKGSVTLNNIDNLYFNPPGLPPYPPYDEGASIGLQADGGDAGYGPFSLKGFGVAVMKVPTTPLLIEDGKPVTLTWSPAGKTGPTRVVFELGINLHGAVDTKLICDVEDTGSFTVPAALVTELFKHGISGFPRVELTRQSADSIMLKSGCVQFSVTSKPLEPRELKVPGLVSCKDQMDCSGGQRCRDDLSCGI